MTRKKPRCGSRPLKVTRNSLVATSAATVTATTVATTPAAATVAPTTTTSAATSTAARTATAAARTISAAISGTGRLRSIDAIEVWLVAFFEFSAAFEGQAASHRRRDCDCLDWSSFLAGAVLIWRRSAAHFCALLFQDGFARKPNAIAFDRQHFHQHLIAFLQLVANIFNAMLGDFADV